MKDSIPTLGERITEFMEGNCLTDKVIRVRNKMGVQYEVPLSEVLGDFYEFMGTRKVKED
jgi:translation elongation factor EF-4